MLAPASPSRTPGFAKEPRRRPGRKPQDVKRGKGHSLRLQYGFRRRSPGGCSAGAGAPGRSRLPSKPAQTKARRRRSARGGRGGRLAQAQTITAPASGRPAASLPPGPSPVQSPRLTIPGRAHELVQQGPHLRLGGHGDRRGRQGRPRRLLSARRRGRRRRRLVASASSSLGSFPSRGTPGGSASRRC